MKKKTFNLLIFSIVFFSVLILALWDVSIDDKASDASNSSKKTGESTYKPVDPGSTNLSKDPSSKKDYSLDVEASTEENPGSAILGRPTDSSIAINIIAAKGMEAFVEYGTVSGIYNEKTSIYASQAGEPIEIEINDLNKDTKYYYRVNSRKTGQIDFTAGEEYSFNTARPKGSTFTFAIQGDSHPERTGKMFNPDLYKQTMSNVLLAKPDFYFTIGDDFSIEKLIDKKTLSQEEVDKVYLNQRNYLGIIGSSVPLFLVNGNHEQAAKYLLDGTPDSAAVYAASSRLKYYPLPAPDKFYSGDLEEVKYVGLPRDYYAFEWGDALFVVIDPYWHSDVAVDNPAGGNGAKRKDLWDITLGEEQYQWLKKTLEESDTKYKLVFSHHILGTGRGGIENAKLYEWGGYSDNGLWEFGQRRPTWEMPIHQLMVKNNVSIFFQGHDHLFAYQKLDGIVYQSLPSPADDTYTAFNGDAYKTGDKLPNSGYVKVTVSPEKVNVEYIRSFLPGDGVNGQIAYAYEVLP